MDLAAILTKDASSDSSNLGPPLVVAKKRRRRRNPGTTLSWSESSVFHNEESREPTYDDGDIVSFRATSYSRTDSTDWLSGASTGQAPSDHNSPLSQTPLPSTPAELVPSQLGLCGEEDAGDDCEPFPLPLFVTAIGEGKLSEDTPPKERERLLHIMRKVPKDQQTSVELACGSSLQLKLRLFAVGSEDARAVAAYLAANPAQRPAPFVVLAHELPMAALLPLLAAREGAADSTTLDRLRKQAKTRAVRLLRSALQLPSAPCSPSALRGLDGPSLPAELLGPALARLASPFAVKGVSRRLLPFLARGSPPSAPSSRKRPDEAPEESSVAAIRACSSSETLAPRLCESRELPWAGFSVGALY